MGLLFTRPSKFKPTVPTQSVSGRKQEQKDRVGEVDKVIVKDQLPLSTTLQFAQEGEVLPIVYGNRDVDVRGIWWGNYNKLNGTVDFAVGMTGNEIEGISKIWDMSKGGRLILNNDDLDGAVSLNKYCASLRVYKGTLTQEPDSRILSIEGEDAPGWPGNSYLVVIGYKLEMTQNKLPQWRVKVIGKQSDVPDYTEEIYSYNVGVGGWNSLFSKEASVLSSFSNSLYLASKGGGGDDPAIWTLNETDNNFEKEYDITYGTQPYEFAELDSKLYLALEDRVYEIGVTPTNTSLPNVNNITVKSMTASSSKIYVVVDNATYNHVIYSYNGSSWTLEHEADQGITTLDVQAMVWHKSNLYICHADPSDTNKSIFRYNGVDTVEELNFDDIAYGAFSIDNVLYLIGDYIYYLDEETDTFEVFSNQISDIANIGSDLIKFRNRLHLGALNNVRRQCKEGEAWNKLVPQLVNYSGEFTIHKNKLYFMDLDNIDKPRQGNIVYTCHKEARYY